jgi:hypothetical protein
MNSGAIDLNGMRIPGISKLNVYVGSDLAVH